MNEQQEGEEEAEGKEGKRRINGLFSDYCIGPKTKPLGQCTEGDYRRQIAVGN